MVHAFATRGIDQFDGKIELLFRRVLVLGLGRKLEPLYCGANGTFSLSVPHSSLFILALSFGRRAAVEHVLPPKVSQLYKFKGINCISEPTDTQNTILRNIGQYNSLYQFDRNSSRYERSTSQREWSSL